MRGVILGTASSITFCMNRGPRQPLHLDIAVAGKPSDIFNSFLRLRHRLWRKDQVLKDFVKPLSTYKYAAQLDVT